MIEKKIEQLSKENCCRAEGFIDGLLASQGDVERTTQRVVEIMKLLNKLSYEQLQRLYELIKAIQPEQCQRVIDFAAGITSANKDGRTKR